MLLAAASGYVIGSLSVSAAVARRSGAVGLRDSGSGNPGAANALRVLGRRAAVAVAATDVAKGAAACAAGRALAGDAGAHVAGVAAVSGHCYPLWARFDGGKGIATSLGQCLATFPAFAPLDVALALGAYRAGRGGRPALVSAAVSSSAWILAGVVWWRRRLPNLWGPPPSGLLPAANAATVAVIALRSAHLLARQRRGASP